MISDVETVSQSTSHDKKEEVKVESENATFYDNKISFLANLCEYFKNNGVYRSANEFREDSRVQFDVGDPDPEPEETKATEAEVDNENNDKPSKSKKRNKKKNKNKGNLIKLNLMKIRWKHCKASPKGKYKHKTEKSISE